MINLARHYEEENDDENTIKYYLMAIEKDNTNAIFYLGEFYKERKIMKI